MNEEIVKSLAQGGVLGVVIGLVVLYQGKHIAQLTGEIRELIGLLRERFKLTGMICLVSLGLLAGCGTTVEACYVHPEYGQVCVKYDGKLHVRADISADPAKLAEVREWLKKQGVEVK